MSWGRSPGAAVPHTPTPAKETQTGNGSRAAQPPFPCRVGVPGQAGGPRPAVTLGGAARGNEGHDLVKGTALLEWWPRRK